MIIGFLTMVGLTVWVVWHDGFAVGHEHGYRDAEIQQKRHEFYDWAQDRTHA